MTLRQAIKLRNELTVLTRDVESARRAILELTQRACNPLPEADCHIIHLREGVARDQALIDIKRPLLDSYNSAKTSAATKKAAKAVAADEKYERELARIQARTVVFDFAIYRSLSNKTEEPPESVTLARKSFYGHIIERCHIAGTVWYSINHNECRATPQTLARWKELETAYNATYDLHPRLGYFVSNTGGIAEEWVARKR